MARHVVVLLAALALIAGACAGSEPAASEPSPTAVADATPTPAPTVTPLPEPTATAAPTPTPAPSEEELAVIAAWERYVVLSAQARSNDPSPEALDFESYTSRAAVQGNLDALQGDRDAGRYLLGSVETKVTTVTFRPDGDAVVEACIVTDYVAHSVEDDSIILAEGRTILRGRGRLVLLGGTWLVAAKESEVGECEG